MKQFFSMALLLLASQTWATNYYFSSTEGNDSRTSLEAQNPSTPWQSLKKLNSFFSNLLPGDSVLFKSGDVFVGSLNISRSGTSGAPITIASYGAGNGAIFQYNVAGAANTPINQRVIIYGSGQNFISIDHIIFTDTTQSASTIHTAVTANTGYAVDMIGNNNQFTDLNISLVGIGLEMEGDNNSVLNCSISDLGGVRNNLNDQSNYGANAILLIGSNNIISHNTFKNCWRTDQTFGYDGGAIEIFGQARNNQITYNVANNCEGVCEIGGSSAADIADNDLFAYNLFVNNGGRIFTLHNGGDGFSININGITAYNNTIVETVEQFQANTFLLWSSSASTTGLVVLKNNIFWLQTKVSVTKTNYFSGYQLVHSNNIYRLAGGSLNFSTDATELNIGTATSVFGNTSSSDPVNWDYTPNASSPAIDFGINLGFTIDIKGNPVFTGKSPDAGTVETVDATINIFYKDADKDGWGNAADSISTTSTTPPDGYVTKSGDCNDSVATIYPGAPEICGNGVDDNCNGSIDEFCTATQTSYTPPSITIADTTAYASSGKAIVRVILSSVFDQPVTVAYTTIKGTARDNKQYIPAKGTLTIPAGDSYGTIAITLINSSTALSSKYFYVKISNAINGTIADNKATVTILYSQPPATAKIYFNPPATDSVEPNTLMATVQPNPANDHFNLSIQSSDTHPVKVRSIDMSGRIIETRQGIAPNSTIQLGHNFRAGMYIIQIEQGGKLMKLKALKTF